MKKFLIAASFVAGMQLVSAQSATQPDSKTWYHSNYATTKVYGINTENAYKFLESKGLKPKTVVVGVLDSGVEVDHPGLVRNMWRNPNEVPNNGKDDDKNGYIDDIYGWNFIGGKNGDIDVDNLEVTRMVKKYQSVFDGPNAEQNKANQAKMPEEYEIYQISKKIFNQKGNEAKQQYQSIVMLQKLIPTMVQMLGTKSFTKENVAALQPTNQQQAIAKSVMTQFVEESDAAGKSAAEFEKSITKELKDAGSHFESQATKQYNLDFDPRASIVGDNYDDYSERFYGNNSYEGPDASHGTHVAGIIAGLPHGDEKQYGVASRVAKIMTVRTVPDGDERDKDVANAIRYAVDNGAKILNMSFGKPVSPGKKYVWDAFRYAENKGVLLVKAAGNENENIAEHIAYPTNFHSATDTKPMVSNVLVVGASTKDPDNLRASFSNFNQTMVDVFAPGHQIYSTVPDGKYESMSGTSMASPVAAGAAAVLLAYMPTLTPAQIIESLVMSANKSTVNAMLPTNTNNRFDMISRAGGVIDLEKAAEYAYTHFYKKGTSTATPVKVIKKKVKTVKRK